MKSRIIRLCLSFGGGCLLIAAMFLWGVREADPVEAFAPPNVGNIFPHATFHLWQINEIFSCADGSVQFIEMVTNSTGQEFLSGHQLRASSGAENRSFIFPFNMPTYTTTPKYLLIATSGFGSLPGGVTPDYILTSSLIFTNGAAGSVSLIGAATSPLNYSAGQLPLDGINSLSQSGVTSINSPRNFAGQEGSVSCLHVPELTLAKTADAPGIVEAGIVMTYTIRAQNQGTAAATNGLITDTVPLSVTYVPNSASNGGVLGSGIISWANLTINPGATLTRTFQVTIGSTITTGDKITNTAYITSAQGASDVASVVVTGGSPTSQRIYLPLILKN